MVKPFLPRYSRMCFRNWLDWKPSGCLRRYSSQRCWRVIPFLRSCLTMPGSKGCKTSSRLLWTTGAGGPRISSARPSSDSWFGYSKDSCLPESLWVGLDSVAGNSRQFTELLAPVTFELAA